MNIYGHKIGLRGAQAIADALKQNTSLKILNIPRVYIPLEGRFPSSILANIEQKGAQILANALKSGTFLEELFIGNNELRVDGAKMFAEVPGGFLLSLAFFADAQAQ